jgi:dTDP-glucose 4,6-dehydratase
MRILVTGSRGAVGTTLVHHLEALGHEVFCSDLMHHGEGRYMRCDVGEDRQVMTLFAWAAPDLVYHLAAEFGRHNGEDYYESLWTTNVIGTKNMLRACQTHHARIVIFSSSEVYGNYPGVMDEFVPMTHGLHSLNDYAMSKRVNEMQAMNSQADYLIVRLFNTYGPGEHWHPYRSALCTWIHNALIGRPFWASEGQERGWTYIADTCRTLANITDHWHSGGIYNIANPISHSNVDVARMVLEITGADPDLLSIVPAEQQTTTRKLVTTARAKNDLDHKCSMDLHEGIAATVAWMRG